jgi:hypothetical protein
LADEHDKLIPLHEELFKQLRKDTDKLLKTLDDIHLCVLILLGSLALFVFMNHDKLLSGVIK